MNTKALKQKILDLAIHGKLLPLDKVEKIRKEEPASILLEKIRAEKEEKIAKGELKKDKKDSFIFLGDDKCHYEKFADGSVKDIEDEIPFDIPDGWSWCRLGEICSVLMGQSPKGSSVSNIQNGLEFHQGKIFFTDRYIAESGIYTSEITKIAPENSLLLCVRAPVGVVNITKRKICIGRGLCAIKSNYIIDEKFWFYWIQCQKTDFEQKATGTTFKAISVDIIKQQFIPLPPLAEQQLIVSEIEKIFAQIDLLEQNKTDLQTAIKQAKSKILNLAIHGKLVSQDPNDEPASVLLEKIRAEKQEKIAKGELKKDKKDSFIFLGDDKCHYEKFADGSVKDIEDEIPFELPNGWSWVRLSLLGEYKKGPFGSALTKSMFVPRAETTIKVYEQKNAIHKNYSLGDYYITKEYFEEKMKSFEVFPGDIIVSCAGTIGETYILPKNIERGIINQALMRMKITDKINTEYFLMFFDHILKEESVKSGKGTAIKNIPPFDIFKQFLIPLPPLSEQQRIVSKIEEIFAILDRISSELGADI